MLVEKYVEVEVTLEDFTDDELMNELDKRGFNTDKDPEEIHELITEIYQLRNAGKDYDKQVENLIWQTIGRM